MSADDPSTLATAVAVATARLNDAADDIRDLRGEVRDAMKEKVSRSEWMLRNDNVNTRFDSLNREVMGIKRGLEARRAPWWSTAAVVASVGALVWAVLGPVVTGR